nr:unnamed protein product [Callosobruchus analis]
MLKSLIANNSKLSIVVGLLPCPNCGKVYKQKCSKYRHLRYECGKSPGFSCTYPNSEKVICESCKKPFKNHNSWRVHYKQDCIAAKKYLCIYCSFVSKRRFSLKNHLLKKHQPRVIYAEKSSRT